MTDVAEETAETRFGTWRRLPREVWMLIIARGVNSLGKFTMAFLTVLITHNLGGSVTTAGWLMLLFGLGTIPSRLTGGLLADRIGRRATLMTGLIATATAQLGLAASQTLLQAAIAIFCVGLAFEIFEPATTALVADVVEPADRTAAYTLLYIAMFAAELSSGLLAAGLGRVDLRLLFVVDSITCLACAALISRSIPRQTRRAHVDALDHRPKTNPWRDKALLTLAGAATLFGIAYLQIDTTLALTLDKRGHSPADTGFLLAVSVLVIVAVQPILSRIRWLAEGYRSMVLGFAIFAAGVLVNGFAHSLASFVAATVLWSIGDGILLGRLYALAASIAPPDARGRYLSIYGLCWSISATVAPVIGTQLLAHVGPIGVWSFAGGSGLMLALIWPVVYRIVDERSRTVPVLVPEPA